MKSVTKMSRLEKDKQMELDYLAGYVSAKIEDTKEKRILLPQQKTLLTEPEEINHYLMLRVASDWWSNGEGYDMKPRQSWIEIGDNDEMYFCWD